MLDRFMVGVEPLRRSTPTALDIAWAAGLFEGEGYWNTRSSNDRKSLAMNARLASTDRDVVEKFLIVVGFGTVTERRPTNPRAKLQYHWESGRRDDIKKMASLFLPYLGERRGARARELMLVPSPIPQILRSRPTHCRRGHLYDDANTLRYIGANGQPWRRCRRCDRVGERDRKRNRNGVTPDRFKVKETY